MKGDLCVYAIYTTEGGNDTGVYIGSTTMKLNDRINCHKSGRGKFQSELHDAMRAGNYRVEIIETVCGAFGRETEYKWINNFVSLGSLRVYNKLKGVKATSRKTPVKTRFVAYEISEYMKQKGIKQIYLAKQTGIKEQTLSCLLTGKTEISPMRLYKICKALGEPMERFANEKTIKGREA